MSINMLPLGGLGSFLSFKYLLIYKEYILRRRREEHSGDILRSLVILHAQQLRCPSEVLLLRQFRMPAEYNMETLCGTSLQHQQSELILLLQNQMWHISHFLLIVSIIWIKIDIHANRATLSLASLQRKIATRSFLFRRVRTNQTVVHLHHVPFVGTAILLTVTKRHILFLGEDRTHHLAPTFNINKVNCHR